MDNRNFMTNNKGMTLIELLVVITVISILIVALGFQFTGWVSGYKVESQTKELYIDLINTRARAMQRNRMHFVDLAGNQYNIYEDDNPAPNGDDVANTAVDTRLSQRNLEPRYPIISSIARIQFDTNGLANSLGNKYSICSNAPSDADGADYNCITISSTRIKMGKLTTSIANGGACGTVLATAVANCVEK